MSLIGSHYELGDEIGWGGEARVHRARDLQIDREVAIRLPLDPRSEFRPGVPATQHPGWVRLFHRGVDEKLGPFQVFELLSGSTLRAQVEQAPLAQRAWTGFVRQSLDAVGALHQAGWVHGDLNADNFIVIQDSTWKLLELPFHRFETSEKRSALFGSIYTLAPEQLRGSPPDYRSDLYSLGCLYYYAAAGHYPHAGGSAPEIAVDRLGFDPEPIRKQTRELQPEQERFVMKLLGREPANRPATIAAARQLLEIENRIAPGD